MGYDRKRKNNDKAEKNKRKKILTPLQSVFDEYSQEYDREKDQAEKIYKFARDVTIESKRVIFSLQRYSEKNQNVLDEAKAKLDQIQMKLDGIRKELETNQFLYWKTHYRFGFGLEEWMEAVSFYHFLKHGTLISKEELEKFGQFRISDLDYVMGVSDISGELMRYATNAMTSGDRVTCSSIADFLREMYTSFLGMHRFLENRKGWNFKLKVFSQNLAKVENLCYEVVLLEKGN